MNLLRGTYSDILKKEILKSLFGDASETAWRMEYISLPFFEARPLKAKKLASLQKVREGLFTYDTYIPMHI